MPRALLLLACALVLALAGCSSSSESSGGGTATSGGSTAASGTTSSSDGSTTGGSGSTNGAGATTDGTQPATAFTLTVAETSLGTILANGTGHTVYLFTPDKKNKSVCTGPCTADWPPLSVSGEPTFGDGIDAGLVKVIKRPDGSKQLSYAGHPLYTFSGDANSGDVNGQSIGGVWFAVAPDGQRVG